MDLVRRSVAALAGLFLLQLMLLGSGTACAMRHGIAGPSSAPRAQAGMRHQASSHETVVVDSNDSSAPMDLTGCGETAHRDGCRLPFAPRQCSSMTTCDVNATLAAATNVFARVRPRALELPSPPRTYTDPSFAPELPPPRA
jgi:hypothetical protein